MKLSLVHTHTRSLLLNPNSKMDLSHTQSFSVMWVSIPFDLIAF